MLGNLLFFLPQRYREKLCCVTPLDDKVTHLNAQLSCTYESKPSFKYSVLSSVMNGYVCLCLCYSLKSWIVSLTWWPGKRAMALPILKRKENRKPPSLLATWPIRCRKQPCEMSHTATVLKGLSFPQDVSYDAKTACKFTISLFSPVEFGKNLECISCGLYCGPFAILVRCSLNCQWSRLYVVLSDVSGLCHKNSVMFRSWMIWDVLSDTSDHLNLVYMS